MANKVKLTSKHIEVFEKVVNSNVLYCTDEELFFLFEDSLKENKIPTISYATYREYKNNPSSYIEKFPELTEIFIKLLALVKKALLKEKANLFVSMKDKEETQWQKYAWILERKFKEWNLKQVQEVTSVNKNVEIDYSNLSDEELNSLIDIESKLKKSDN